MSSEYWQGRAQAAEQRIAELEGEVERLRADRQALMDSTEVTAKIVLSLGKEVEWLRKAQGEKLHAD